MSKFIVLFIIIFLSVIPLLSVQNYQVPTKKIQEIFNRKPTPAVSLFEKYGTILEWERTKYLPLEMLSMEKLSLAGINITPVNNARVRSGYYTNPILKNIDTGKTIKINVPENGIFGSETKSFNQRYFLFNQYKKDTISLWCYDLKKKSLQNIIPKGLNQAIGSCSQWIYGDEKILVKLIPENRKERPRRSKIPLGPVIFESNGIKSQRRTYSDLIKDDFDKKNFDYFTRSQLAIFDIKTSKIKKIGIPHIFAFVSPSPNGKYLLVKIYDDEFSTRIPLWGFASRYEIWDMEGNLVKEIHKAKSRENVRPGGTLTGPRLFSWHPFIENSIVYIEALDEGNPDKEVEYRDAIFVEDIFNKNSPQQIYKTENRYNGINFISSTEFIIQDYNRKRRWETVKYFNLENGKSLTIKDISTQEKYNDPGDVFRDISENYTSYVPKQNGCIFLQGRKYEEDGIYPFLDAINLNSGNKTNIWKSNKGFYEGFIKFIDGFDKALIYSENAIEPRNYFFENLNTNFRKTLTNFQDPAPELTNLHRELIKYKRKDGVELSGMLYLPKDRKQNERLPLIITAYPREYTSTKTASQTVNSSNKFTRFWGSSPLYLCLEGYAVLKGASVAIVGTPEEVNDTFIKQLVSSVEAPIDYLDSLKIIDPKQVVVMGHSYGAFMVVNLLAHSDKFAGGIAKNGAYNRTLTPFGFQSERRTLWEAKETYMEISPFMFADKIKKPLLLIHSQEDRNSGTYPLQSKRLFQAIEGNGGNCRYIELPLEDHSYFSKETHLHLLKEYLDFLNKCCKQQDQ